MTKVEFTQTVMFGDKMITSIDVKPLLFLPLCEIWGGLRTTGTKVRGELQRARILHQTTFKAGDEVVAPDAVALAKLPVTVAKDIIQALELGSGRPGVVTAKGDGATSPVIYKLGTPIEMKQGAETVSITELEFMASTYGELEDVLAADTDADKALILIRDIAVPLGVKGLQRVPGWALDRITAADGIGVMNTVSPLF